LNRKYVRQLLQAEVKKDLHFVITHR
jgi:hypothetical protein